VSLEAGPGSMSPSLGDLVARARFEVIPMGGIEDKIVEFVPAGSSLTVTCSPNKGPDRTLDLAERLAVHGYQVLSHISARTVQSREHLQEILGRLEAPGLRRVFAIGGDGHDPAGPYASAGELLVAMADIGHALEEVGVGGYPEGHPLIEDSVLLESLIAKQPFATHVATQICFEPQVVANWIARIREHGIELPVFLGMAGSVNRRRLIEVSLRVGVGPSVKYATKYGGLVARLMRRGGYRPDAFVARIAPFVANRDYGIGGFHVYTFNQVESTERWRQELVASYGRAARPIAVVDDEEDTAS
jgi:methylenetetrahydrofolate reductase (NADPH)